MKTLLRLLALSSAFCAVACQSSGSKEKGDGPTAQSSTSRSGGAQGAGESKAPASQITGSARTVTTAITNDGGIEGSVPDQVLSETLMALDELARKEPDNVPLMVTYMGLLRLYAQNPSLAQDVQRRAGVAGAKNFWYLLEASYGAITRKDFALADYLLAKATKNSKDLPMAKVALQHASGVRLYFDGKPQAGVFEMKKAALADPPFLPSILTIGFMSLKSGDYAGAEQMFERATGVAPNSLNAKLGLAVARRVRGKSEEAIALLGQIYRQKPDDRRVTWNYALALSEGEGASQKKALDVLGKYFQLPGSYPELDARANALMTKLQSAPPPEAPKPAGGAAPAPAAAAGK